MSSKLITNFIISVCVLPTWSLDDGHLISGGVSMRVTVTLEVSGGVDTRLTITLEISRGVATRVTVTLEISGGVATRLTITLGISRGVATRLTITLEISGGVGIRVTGTWSQEVLTREGQVICSREVYEHVLRSGDLRRFIPACLFIIATSLRT